MVQGAGGTKLLSVPFTTGRVPLLLMIPVGRNAGTVVVRVKVRVMRVERVFMKEVVSDSAAAVVTGKAVAGGSDWIVTVMVPRSSDDESTGREVTSGAVGDAADGAGERTGPMGPAGKLVLVGSAGPLSRYPAKNFSISARRCSRSEIMARRSSGRSLRPDWIV